VALRDEEKIHAAPDVLSRTLDGEAVLLDLRSGTYFGLNEVGTHIWERLREGATVAELRARVLETFEVDAATAERDLEELLAELTRRQLVTREG
jgi:PqqD family protein of HPr-rel-A system